MNCLFGCFFWCCLHLMDLRWTSIIHIWKHASNSFTIFFSASISLEDIISCHMIPTFTFQWHPWDQLFKGYQDSGDNWTLHIFGEGCMLYAPLLAFASWHEIFHLFDCCMELIACCAYIQKGPAVADTVIGEGNTTMWKMCGLDKSTCLTVFFDLSSSDRSSTPGTANPQLYLQFLTR